MTLFVPTEDTEGRTSPVGLVFSFVLLLRLANRFRVPVAKKGMSSFSVDLIFLDVNN